jgi:general stress protein 26
MAKPELIHLSTVDSDGYPQTRVLANTRCGKMYPSFQPFLQDQQPFHIFLATHSRSDKVKQIRENSKSCVYFVVPEEFRSLSLVGDMERVKDREIKQALWIDDWKQFYPDGPLGKSFAVFSLKPFMAKGWWESRPFTFDIK